MKTDYTVRRRTYRVCDNPECVSGKTETGEDDYGSHYSIDCRRCNGFGAIFEYTELIARKNKNGTFTTTGGKFE